MPDGSSQETTGIPQVEPKPKSGNFLSKPESPNNGIVGRTDQSDPEKYKDLPKKLKPGDILEFKDHFTTHMEDIGSPLYEIELGRAGYNYDQVQEMIKYKKVPKELDKQIREKLAARNMQSFEYVGEWEIPKATVVTPDKQYGADDYMSNKKVDPEYSGRPDRVSPEQIGTNTIYIGTDMQSKAFSGTESGVYGSAEQEFTYFTSDPELALSHAGENPVLLEVDLNKLAEKRHIFPDPEARGIPSEKGRTFVVMGGIPLGAVIEGSIFKRI
jgi:hypothetical protein